MPIKFSELTQKSITQSSYVAGLYVDSTSETTQSNCKIPISDFAKQNDLETNYVNLSGSQSITGEKKFTSAIVKQSLVIDSTSAPATTAYNQLNFVDKNGVKMGSIENDQYINSSIETILNCQKIVSSNTVYSQIKAGITAAGDPYTYAPTPPTSDNSTQIATTAWARTLLSSILSGAWPVGSIFLGIQATCPLASLIPGSTWELLPSSKALWTSANGTNVGTTIEAGLPNITGRFDGNGDDGSEKKTGCFYQSGTVAGSNGAGTGYYIYFDASICSTIYGKSSTVQPNAYVINAWRRTA